MRFYRARDACGRRCYVAWEDEPLRMLGLVYQRGRYWAHWMFPKGVLPEPLNPDASESTYDFRSRAEAAADMKLTADLKALKEKLK